MTTLREKMTRDLQLCGLRERTQEAYLRSVRKLAEHYGQSPDRLTEQQLRDYFLYLRNEKKFSFGGGDRFPHSGRVGSNDLADVETSRKYGLPAERPAHVLGNADVLDGAAGYARHCVVDVGHVTGCRTSDHGAAGMRPASYSYDRRIASQEAETVPVVANWICAAPTGHDNQPSSYG